jgi:hypothetical protein
MLLVANLVLLSALLKDVGEVIGIVEEEVVDVILPLNHCLLGLVLPVC